MELTIFDATPQDVEIITLLIRAAFAEYKGKLNPPSSAHAETPNQIQEKLLKGGAALARINGEEAGCVVYYPQDSALYLGRLSVLPAFRKHGVGQALVAHVERKARQMGFSKVQLSVRIVLPDNRVFFERQGYQVVSTHSHSGYAEPTFVTLEKSTVML